ncbi:hypothetical protein GAYE_SCF18G3913 [Galdieria yellowstonensis]|uniref:Uncharacterized protein n=1 Tax=Galdieria yellowstonensis TaxID=3028027 RepID=A0AAV9IFB6_9RHOD|nr:hypothetical protein GAYE_SCF18G3913 [Galdieria yellowstonensis]
MLHWTLFAIPKLLVVTFQSSAEDILFLSKQKTLRVVNRRFTCFVYRVERNFEDSVACLVCYLLTSELDRVSCRAWWDHFKLLWILLDNSLLQSLIIVSSEKSKQDAGAVTQANKHSTIEAKVMQTKSKNMKAVSSLVGSVRQGEFDWLEFLKTYCNLTEFEARECSDMLKVIIEEDSMGVDTAVLERLGNRGPSNSTESCCWYKKLHEK